ncbi:MAG: hypothetical protein V4616_09710 [Bacteroidota bacterium]
MKRLLFLFAILTALVLSGQTASAQPSTPETTSFNDWLMAKQGYWFGRIDGKSWWYRFNEDNTVSRSADARNWEGSEPVVGKDAMGVVIRLTKDEVLTGENQLNAWIPILNREWDQEKGLDYQNSYVPLIWSMELPRLYRTFY